MNSERLVVQWEQRLRKESKAEGIAEGKAEGLAEGIAEGKAGAILAMLAARGLKVDAAAAEQIRTDPPPFPWTVAL